MKKFAFWAAIGVAVWWTVQDPVAAAHLVHGVGAWLSSAARALSTITSS